jgi:hypothetical protein
MELLRESQSRGHKYNYASIRRSAGRRLRMSMEMLQKTLTWTSSIASLVLLMTVEEKKTCNKQICVHLPSSPAAVITQTACWGKA